MTIHYSVGDPARVTRNLPKNTGQDRLQSDNHQVDARKMVIPNSKGQSHQGNLEVSEGFRECKAFKEAKIITWPPISSSLLLFYCCVSLTYYF